MDFLRRKWHNHNTYKKLRALWEQCGTEPAELLEFLQLFQQGHTELLAASPATPATQLLDTLWGDPYKELLPTLLAQLPRFATITTTENAPELLDLSLWVLSLIVRSPACPTTDTAVLTVLGLLEVPGLPRRSTLLVLQLLGDWAVVPELTVLLLKVEGCRILAKLSQAPHIWREWMQLLNQLIGEEATAGGLPLIDPNGGHCWDVGGLCFPLRPLAPPTPVQTAEDDELCVAMAREGCVEGLLQAVEGSAHEPAVQLQAIRILGRVLIGAPGEASVLMKQCKGYSRLYNCLVDMPGGASQAVLEVCACSCDQHRSLTHRSGDRNSRS